MNTDATRPRILRRFVLWIAAPLLLASLVPGCFSGYETIEVDGAKRRYLVHVPDTLASERPAPLVLALHQFSDTPRGMRRMTRLDALADEHGFIVVYPKGQWRRWRSNPAPHGGPDTRFLLALLDRLLETHAIDETRIYATGASAGAMMIQTLVCHTHRIAAIAPVMGSLTEEQTRQNPEPDPVSVLVIHGMEDTVVPFDGGQAGGPHASRFLSAADTATFWAEAAGCDTPPEILTETMPGDEGVLVEHHRFTCPGEHEVALLAVAGCGHSWPGHKSRYPGCIVGPSVSTPDATALIWAFFERHSIKKDR